MKRGLIGITAAVALAMAGQGTAAAQEHPPEGIIWMALRDINASYFDADDPTNRPPLVTVPPDGMIRALDISHDGRPDWLVDYKAAGLSAYCGTGGCLKRLYISDGGDYVRAFDAQAFDLQPAEADGETRLEAWVHQLYCADDSPAWADDNPDCRYAFAWDARERRLIPRSSTSARPMGTEAFIPLRSPEE